MKVVLRIIVFVLLVVSLNVAGLLGLGMLAGKRAAAKNGNPVAAQKAAHAADQEMIFHYWPTVAAVITLISALAAFGVSRGAALVAGGLAIGTFFLMHLSVIASQARHSPSPPEALRPPGR